MQSSDLRPTASTHKTQPEPTSWKRDQFPTNKTSRVFPVLIDPPFCSARYAPRLKQGEASARLAYSRDHLLAALCALFGKRSEHRQIVFAELVLAVRPT
jgi:hypothetical protein